MSDELEWNYAIDPDATDKTLDWKAFLGPAPERAFDPERYFAASLGAFTAGETPTLRLLVEPDRELERIDLALRELRAVTT